MDKYDNILAKWAKQNSETIYRYLETNINPEVNWRNDDIVRIVSSCSGWPSELEFEPYFEELQHALNDDSDEYGVPIPKELIAHKLSLWAGQPVPVNHSLVVNNKHWRDVALDIEFDNVDENDAVMLYKLLHQVAVGETANNLASIDDVIAHYESPTISGSMYTVNIGESLIYLVVGDGNIAAMNDDGVVVVMDFDGNIIPTTSTDRIKNYIVQGMKISRPLTERGELASLVGNDTADLLLGVDGLSVFDLPGQ